MFLLDFVRMVYIYHIQDSLIICHLGASHYPVVKDGVIKRYTPEMHT